MDTTTIEDTTDADTAGVSAVSESNPVGHDAEHGKGEGHTPVTLCHEGHTIVVDDDAVPGHLEHHAGDYAGQCALPTDGQEGTEEGSDEQSNPVGHDEVGATDDATHTTTDDVWHMTPCTYEDGSEPGQEFPCIWDAEHVGNGTGDSFVLDEAGGTPHYVTDVLADGTVLTAADVLPADAVAQVQVPVSNPVGLAETGMNATAGCGIAVALVVIGVAFIRLRKRGAM